MPGAKVCVQFICPEAGGRASPVILSQSYRPHFRVDTGEYLGVQFVGGCSESAEAGVPISAEVTFAYAPEVNYEALKVGAQFQILEGRRIVGVGVVTELNG
jgi:translation elongation factor EF-Tu-like GTPase